jgi:hypothetical protein
VPKKAINFDSVRKIGLEFPGVEASTAYGAPALKFRGQLLACIPTHRSAEPDSLAVRVDFNDRDHLLAEAPDTYYITDHYTGCNAVLVRLSRVNSGVLHDLLAMACKFLAAKTKAASRPRNRRTQSRREN